jgi:hypothetical protein
MRSYLTLVHLAARIRGRLIFIIEGRTRLGAMLLGLGRANLAKTASNLGFYRFVHAMMLQKRMPSLRWLSS